MSHPDYKDVGTPEARLMEEIGELLQAMGKADRFGYFSSHPDHPERINKMDVLDEMYDVQEAIKNLREHLYQLEKDDEES